MQRIDTPTKAVDLFGPGRDGFQSGGPGGSTRLSPAWCNSVQEELARAIEDQGYVLDPLNLGQLTIALNGWKWSGEPHVLAGATLYVDGGGTIVVQDGGDLDVESGGSLVIKNGGSFSCSGGFSVTGDGTFAVACHADFSGSVAIGGTLGVAGAVTCNGDVTIADAALFKTGRVAFSGPVFPDGERQLATLGDGRLIYRRTEDVSVDLIFCSTSGWTYATGEQQEATGFLATNLSLVTAQRIVAQHNTVLVIAEGWGQVNSMGGAIVELQFQYETDLDVWEDVGDPVEVKWVDDADAYTWSFFRIARRLNVGTAIGRLYRLKVAATGGAAGKIRESTIRVVNGQR